MQRDRSQQRQAAAAAHIEISSISISAVALVALMLACLAAPLIPSLPPPTGGSVLEANLPIGTPGHLLGTDLNGNDVLSRLLNGGRTSLAIAIMVNVAGLLIGGSLGAIAAWAGGIADSITMRIMDMLIAFPSLVLVLSIAQTRGPGTFNTILALAILSIPAFARVAHVSVLRLKTLPFITAAQLAGSTNRQILLSHIAPSIFPQLATFGLLGIGIAITLEGALSYLGLGVPLPSPTWGGMISHGQQALLIRPDLLLLPAGTLFLTVLSCNWLGSNLRERLAIDRRT